MTDVSDPSAAAIRSRSRRSRRGWGGAVLALGPWPRWACSWASGARSSSSGTRASRSRPTSTRPIILPCLVALVAAAGAGVACWLTLVRDRGPRWAVTPFLAVGATAMPAAGALTGPSAQEVERWWTDKLADLRLPASFTAVPADPSSTTIT